MRYPVIDDAGFEQRAEHGVDRFGQVRATAKHELGGMRAQHAPRQEAHGYLDLDALGLRYGVVVHEPLELEQRDVPLGHQSVDDALEAGERQLVYPLHERPRDPRGGCRGVHYVQRPRAGHHRQPRVQYLVHTGELGPVRRHRHEATQRRFVCHVDHHAVPQPVDHERPEAAPDGLHTQRLVDGRVVHEEHHGVHAVQFVQLSEEIEHGCGKKNKR